mmetsp:Transcript_7254/g.27671  ORF Transcript_7254/g.27671 Transcript_7254/m.27671 type:complete len:204 (-) Transcript_7254:285-896(-)
MPFGVNPLNASIRPPALNAPLLRMGGVGDDDPLVFPKFPKPMPSRPPRPGCFFCAAGGCGLLLPPNIANGSAFFCGAPPCFCDDCAMPTRSSANGSMGSGDGCDGAAPTSSLKDRSFSPLPELKVAKSCALDAELSSSMPSMSFPTRFASGVVGAFAATALVFACATRGARSALTSTFAKMSPEKVGTTAPSSVTSIHTCPFW